MFDLESVANQPESAPESEKRTRHGNRLQLLAGIVTAALPGVGQILLGKKRAGVVLLILYGNFLIAMWPLRVMTTYTGYVVSALASLLLILYSTYDVLLSRTERSPTRAPLWRLILFVPVVVVFCLADYGIVARIAGFRNFSTPSIAMVPTLVPGERFIVDMHYYKTHSPMRGDIVMYYQGGTFFLKRVAAVEGDTIQGVDGRIYLNGHIVVETYIQHIGNRLGTEELNTFGPITIPPDQYFVMGDNRDVSYDSRSHEHGLIRRDAIVGRPLYIYASMKNQAGQILR